MVLFTLWDVTQLLKRMRLICMHRQRRVSDTSRNEKSKLRASLVAQWLGVRLPMQGTRVRAPVREDPTCCGAAGPVSHGCWACASGACAPQREGPRRGVAPACRNWRGSSHRNEDPTQPKINK